MQTGTAMAHLLAGRFDTAVSWSEKAYRDLPSFLLAVGIVAASHALAGRTDEAQQAVHHLRQLDPTLRSEEHTSELQSLMRISYAVFCLKKKTPHKLSYT